MRRAFGFLIALASSLGINFIPLELLINDDFSSGGAMLLYLCENAVAIVLAVVVVYFFAPKIGEVEIPEVNGKVVKTQTLRETILKFVVPCSFATFASSVFILFIVFGILRERFSSEVFWESMLWIFGFQILEFAGDLLLMQPFTMNRAEQFLNRSFGRVFLLLLCVFLGVFCMAWIDAAFVIPFVILKTIVDVGEQIQLFRDAGRAVAGG